MKRQKLITFLNEYLKLNDYARIDRSLNGLQVAGEEKDIQQIAFAVDACQETIDRAIASGADMLIVHHGLFWGEPLALTASHGRRVNAMMTHHLDLFAAHLPLDAHMEVGNNVVMAQMLKLTNIQPFAYYKGKSIGVSGELSEALSLDKIAKVLHFTHPVALDFAGRPLRKIAIVSGEGADDVFDAKEQGFDLLITGETLHRTYHYCEEEKISMLCGGHYETEVYGVKALALLLLNKFQLQVGFIDVPTGL